ncbi:MAG TPA: anti-sigma factor [Luteibacter sp.]|jgi:anti-sigma factor RsiW|nr:anti-sigma factor [Luteibacter sp.]
MNCNDATLLIHAYLDNELDVVQSLEISRHMTGCEACSAYYRRHAQLKTALANGQMYRRAPAHIRMSFAPEIPVQASRPPRRRSLMSFAQAAALVGFMLFGASALVYGIHQRNIVSTAIVGEAISSHLRSMQARHLVDVVSTDQHTVKPWFDGKLDFSPQVKDLAADGFPLAGGRLDVLQGRSVAALVYHRRLHVINLYQWPADIDSAPQATTNFGGYNVVRWSANGMSYVAVSNVPPDVLALFVRAFRE